MGPMAKKDAVSKLLAEEIALAKRIKNRLKDPPSLSLLDLANPAEKEELAASLWLDEKDPLGGPILEAFKAFGLDHRSVGDWYTLVLHLARVLFPNRRRPGRQRKWSDERLCRLLADVAAAKRKHICKWLEERYRPTSAKTLRRVLQDARNPTRNGELASIAFALVRPQMLREAAPAVTKDASWTEADDQNVRSEVIRATLRKVIEEADKLFVH